MGLSSNDSCGCCAGAFQSNAGHQGQGLQLQSSSNSLCPMWLHSFPGSPSSKLHDAACVNGRTLTLQAQQAVWQRESTLTARRRADAAGSGLVCTARKTHSSCLHFASSCSAVPLPLSDQCTATAACSRRLFFCAGSKMNVRCSKHRRCV